MAIVARNLAGGSVYLTLAAISALTMEALLVAVRTIPFDWQRDSKPPLVHAPHSNSRSTSELGEEGPGPPGDTLRPGGEADSSPMVLFLEGEGCRGLAPLRGGEGPP